MCNVDIYIYIYIYTHMYTYRYNIQLYKTEATKKSGASRGLGRARRRRTRRQGGVRRGEGSRGEWRPALLTGGWTNARSDNNGSTNKSCSTNTRLQLIYPHTYPHMNILNACILFVYIYMPT